MKMFIAGLIVGFALSGGVACAYFSSGFMLGWSVTIKNREICSDPYMWPSLKEIEC